MQVTFANKKIQQTILSLRWLMLHYMKNDANTDHIRENAKLQTTGLYKKNHGK